MSRSNPRRSSIVARVRENSAPADPSLATDRPLRRRLGIRFAALVRWLHIYLSMFGLGAVLFFSVTGITLNHPTWFYSEAEHSTQAEGKLNVKWLRPEPSKHEADASAQVAKLEVVEHLRKEDGVRGALSEFRVEDAECLVAFRGPGYSADAIIDRESGRYTLTQSSHGLVAVMNDLHKGRDTGPVWSVLIDVSAALMTLISLTGLILIFYLKLRRTPGLVIALIGTAVVVLIFLRWVP